MSLTIRRPSMGQLPERRHPSRQCSHPRLPRRFVCDLEPWEVALQELRRTSPSKNTQVPSTSLPTQPGQQRMPRQWPRVCDRRLLVRQHLCRQQALIVSPQQECRARSTKQLQHRSHLLKRWQSEAPVFQGEPQALVRTLWMTQSLQAVVSDQMPSRQWPQVHRPLRLPMEIQGRRLQDLLFLFGIAKQFQEHRRRKQKTALRAFRRFLAPPANESIAMIVEQNGPWRVHDRHFQE